jgi:hypothetical protein
VNVGAARFEQPKVSKNQIKAEVASEIREENTGSIEARLEEVERQTRRLLAARKDSSTLAVTFRRVRAPTSHRSGKVYQVL